MKTKTARSGFTLIELLVVVTIIATLAGFLLPTLFRGQQKAWQVGCQANMKNISSALNGWVTDHKGWLPPGEDGKAGNYGLWCNQIPDSNSGDKYHLTYYLATYLGAPKPTSKSILIPQFICPAFRRQGKNFSMNGRVVYARNTVVRGDGEPAPGIDPFGYPPGSSSEKPPHKLEEVGDRQPLSSTYVLADTDLLAFSPDTWGESGGLPPEPSHVDQRNYVYFDGHVGAKKVPANGAL